VNNQLHPPVRVTIVETEPEFRALAGIWSQAAHGAGDRLFLQHEWFEAAWAWRRQDSTLFMLLAWDDSKLIGVLPLIMIRANRWFGQLRCLQFLTVPDTQMCDLIAAPGDHERVSAAFGKELHKCRDKWDRIVLNYLQDGAAALSCLRQRLSALKYAYDSEMQDRNLFIPLTSSWNEYYAARSRSLKKANNLAANRLKKVGRITIEWITPQTHERSSIRDALDRLIEISGRSWKQQTGNSLDNPGPRNFIEMLTAHAVRRGWLSLWLLYLDGKPLAMEYQLLGSGNVYALRSDFDAQCEEISPGSHLMHMLLESLFDKGLDRYYFGPGKNPYKKRWAEEGETLYQLVIHGKSWRGRLANWFDNVIKPFARTVRDSMTSKAQPGSKEPVKVRTEVG
jgi:CelD/BcsL family acetyltransferase involved in cellulose biosynthesis